MARKSSKHAEHDADLVVRRGRVTKNRLGESGGTIPLPDGCYRLDRLDPPRTTQKH